MKVYLCGPINGCTDEECKDWREAAKKEFIDTLDPMRRDYRGREKECVKEIVEGDKEDIKQCDVLLVNHPKPSVGTSMEIFYAWTLGKKIVVVSPENMTLSPWIIYHSDYLVNSFKTAYTIIKGM